jgi:hypothetical protein
VSRSGRRRRPFCECGAICNMHTDRAHSSGSERRSNGRRSQWQNQVLIASTSHKSTVDVHRVNSDIGVLKFVRVVGSGFLQFPWRMRHFEIAAVAFWDIREDVVGMGSCRHQKLDGQGQAFNRPLRRTQMLARTLSVKSEERIIWKDRQQANRELPCSGRYTRKEISAEGTGLDLR